MRRWATAVGTRSCANGDCLVSWGDVHASGNWRSLLYEERREKAGRGSMNKTDIDIGAKGVCDLD